jgi:GNAT superfamily N-acetyltransferase
MPNFRTEPISPERLPDYLGFFDGPAFSNNPRWRGCYCIYPLHDHQAHAWSVDDAEGNRARASSCVQSCQTSGVLAYNEAGEVVGWCNAGPALLYPALRDLPGAMNGKLGAIFCFVVAPAWRGQGVARALLDGALQLLKDLGVEEVEANPRADTQDPADNHWGPLGLYLSAGFEPTGEADASGRSVRVKKVLVA